MNLVLHAGRPSSLEIHAMHEGASDDLQVRSLHYRVQIRTRGAQPATVADVAVEAGEPFLLIPVDVAGQRVTGLLASVQERCDQRVLRRTTLEHQWPFVAAIFVAASQAVLHLLEVGQTVRVIPGRHALVGGPAFVVQRIPALEDHAVDAAAAAQQLAAGVVHPATVHERLGLTLVLPVVEAAADRKHQCGWHMDKDVPRVVGTTRLEHQYPAVWVGTQPIGQRGPGRAATDDDVVVDHFVGHVSRS